MFLEQLQAHYDQIIMSSKVLPKSDATTEDNAEDNAEDNTEDNMEAEQDNEQEYHASIVLTLDVQDLVDGIRAEYYGKVLPLLEENGGRLPKASIPVIEKAITQINSDVENEFIHYLKFRLNQLIISKTTNDDEDVFKKLMNIN